MRIDPPGIALQLDIHADRGLIQHERTLGITAIVLGTVFLISEDGAETHGLQYLGRRSRIVHFGLDLRPGFVASRLAAALKRQKASRANLSQSQELAGGA